MMTDIFSSFDPLFYQTMSSNYLIWYCATFLLVLLNANLWTSNNLMVMCKNNLMMFMSAQTTQTRANNLEPMKLSLSTLFIFMLVMNLSGLIPYTFSITSHLITTLSFGFPLWLGLMLSSFSKSFFCAIAGLLPSGAPEWLNPVLVMIETISVSVRPITLSFRLAANMSAGHIVLSLISIYLANTIITSPMLTVILLSSNFLYLLFEIAISIIQSYIFCLLVALYADEHQM